MAQLELHYEELSAAGVQVICIAQGELKHMQRYCPKFAPSVTCLTDETTDPYYAYGVQQGKLSQLISLGTALASVRALSKGNVQGESIGDIKMLSAIFIIDQAGVVRYAHYGEHQGDHPPIQEVIAAAASLNQL